MPKVRRKSAQKVRKEKQQLYQAKKISMQHFQEALEITEMAVCHGESDDDIAVIVQNIDTPAFVDESGASTSKTSITSCFKSSSKQDKNYKQCTRYHSDEQFRNKKREASKRRYSQNETYRENQKKAKKIRR